MKDKAKIEEVRQILYVTLEWIRQVSLNLYAFFPEKMSEVFKVLNLSHYIKNLEDWKLKDLREEKVDFDIEEKAPILFQKFELK
jgi:methionyl-tRNA synthetase